MPSELTAPPIIKPSFVSQAGRRRGGGRSAAEKPDGPPMMQIVVVDDNKTNRMIFSRLAASIREDAHVEVFGDPNSVLEWVETKSPDLIITDYKMPGMDGADFIRTLRALPFGADVPVIVITAYDDREFRLRALDAGATDFLQSPVDHQEFITRGRNLLNLGQQQKLARGRAENLQRELERSEQSRETAIRDNRTRLIQVIDTIQAVISAVDEDGRRVFVNRYGAGLLPLNPPEQNEAADTLNGQVFESGLPILGYEEEIIDRRGQRRTFLTSKFPLRDGAGAVRNVLTTSFDISERKRAEEALHHLAHHDALTGLPNRLLLTAVIEQALSRSAADGGRFALHFIDLDRFKGINDGFGHDHGDNLLKEMARRLMRIIRQGDIVARLGGDEFAVVQANVRDAEDARLCADRIIAAISEPVDIERHKAIIGASVGVTLAPQDAGSVEDLLKNADLAVYRAKREGKGCARFFAAEMRTVARASVLLEIDLRQAIEREEFVMVYQPEVDVHSRKVIGAEALLRWQRPGHGLVLPGEFLWLAEDTGLLAQINRWVLQNVCAQGAAWAASGTPICVGVNVSSAIFKAESVRNLVIGTLEKTGLPPHLLELELTESVLLENQREVANELHALRRMGVRVAIDDFGTGYSSLAYLQILPIDRLKIDRSFIQELNVKADRAAIVDAVVGIGRSLNLEVLAEGVENDAQLERVRSAGCHFAQGFYFSRGVPPEKLLSFIGPGTQLPLGAIP
jgi:diguanylate cyclase (GGDEF)-like protein/PAS domain S-box-containing protein